MIALFDITKVFDDFPAYEAVTLFASDANLDGDWPRGAVLCPAAGTLTFWKSERLAADPGQILLCNAKPADVALAVAVASAFKEVGEPSEFKDVVAVLSKPADSDGIIFLLQYSGSGMGMWAAWGAYSGGMTSWVKQHLLRPPSRVFLTEALAHHQLRLGELRYQATRCEQTVRHLETALRSL